MSDAPTVHPTPARDDEGLSAFSAVAWASLLVLALVPQLPRRNAVVDLAALTGLAFLAHTLYHAGLDAILPRPLRTTALLFGLSLLVSTVLSPFASGLGPAGVTRAAHALWNTVTAGVALALPVALVRRPVQLVPLLLLTAVLLCLLSVWAPLDAGLRGLTEDIVLGRTRLTGTKGTAHRYAALLYLGSFQLWVLLLAPRLAAAPLSPRARRWGTVCIAASGLALLRKTLPPAHLAAGWLPGAGDPAHPALFVVLVLLLVGGAVVLWRHLATRPRLRTRLVLLTLCLMLINVALAGARLHLFLALAAGAGAILIHHRLPRSVRLAFLTMAVASLLVLLLHPATLNTHSTQVRLAIWRDSAPLARSHWMTGIGYGTANLRAYRRDHALAAGTDEQLPDEIYHTHNLWLELLLERGVGGLICFHLFWGAALLYLRRSRAALSPAQEPDDESAAALIGMGAVALLLLALDGLLNWPLQGSAEIAFGLLAGLSLAAAKVSRSRAAQPPGDNNIEAIASP